MKKRLLQNDLFAYDIVLAKLAQTVSYRNFHFAAACFLIFTNFLLTYNII